MRNYVRCALLATSTLVATVVAAAGPAKPQKRTNFSPIVDTRGDISFPARFPEGYQHIGTWAVLGAEGVADTHNVYARPKDVIYFRKNGRFPDGAVIIKEVLEAIGSGHTTGKAYWGERGKTWFVMVEDTHGRFTTNPLWGDGWGWAQFDPKDRSRQIATNYKTDCLQCHVPAREMDWIYVYAYPALGEKALRFTPEAARTGGLKAGEGHRVAVADDASSGTSTTAEQRKVLAGKQLFDSACMACHSIKAGEHGIGPSLFGVIGRMAGSAPGYAYSDAMRNAGVTWITENMVKHLMDTRGFIPGNRMGSMFKGVSTSNDGDSIAAYLATLK